MLDNKGKRRESAVENGNVNAEIDSRSVLKDKIRTDEIRRCGVIGIVEKMREAILIKVWHQHEKRRSGEEPIRSIMELNIDGNRGRGDGEEKMERLRERIDWYDKG